MGKKEVLPFTKAETVEERLEELIKNRTLFKCELIRDTKNYKIDLERGQFRSYPDGFEAIGLPEGAWTSGMLYSKEKNMFFYYDYKEDNIIQNSLFKVK